MPEKFLRTHNERVKIAEKHTSNRILNGYFSIILPILFIISLLCLFNE